MAVIGIDLGTTYCAASRYVNNIPEVIYLEGFPTLPSVVSVLPNGKVVVGRTAKRNQINNPQDTIVEVKRKMGENVEIQLGQAKFKPQEISSMILKTIKEKVEEQLGEPVTGAVITCPAYFKEPQRDATKQAGELAGLKVLRILNEPTAAAYAYGAAQQAGDKENLFLVYDLGGGTFDVTVIRMLSGNLEVIGTGGDPQLGGGNFDDRIVDWMIDHLKKNVPGFIESMSEKQKNALRMSLKAFAEEGKIALCGPPLESYQFKIPKVGQHEGKPVPFNETLTMQKFNELILDLMDNSLKWIDVAMEAPITKHKFTEKNLTEILLVGGSTRIPLVRDLLKKRFPDTPISGHEKGINPDEIVAVGAGIVAAQADPDSDEVSESILVDVTGHTLSIAVYDNKRNKLMLSPIIQKETAIPTSAAHQFASMGEFQKLVQIKVYQGEGEDPDAKDVMMIGEFMMEIDPIKESIPLAIGLDLDQNAILTAHATNLMNGKQVKCTINYQDSSKMSSETMKQRQTQIEKQMESGVGSTQNPLDKPGPTQQTSTSTTQTTTTSNPTGDVKDMMNPVIRNIYEKALNNFDKISPENQMQVMQIIGDMENAARAGDQSKLMQLYTPLNNLLKGV